ncbi:MAG: nucleotidyltransferase substrate binding protein [Candidatus Omnitrophica bacterium]|nr:nucleotidyltransferase substrate binding protein [Candidatus Omnitrophota bacterium]
MERLKMKYEDAVKACMTLREIVQEPYSVIVRDAAIQRFEYTFEAVWKFAKEYLKETEGVVCNSPKSCFRELFSLGYLEESETEKFLFMTDRRNDTVHTYKQEFAEKIYNEIKGFYKSLQDLVEKFKF